jgi:prepilin-type processing-associated H-X9-DG protein
LLNLNWQKALYPYGKTPQIFFCPLRVEKPANAEEQALRDKMADDLGVPRSGEPYALNTHLDGLNLADLAEPARTVLFYEGKDEKLDFRHDGKSNVAFTDGHVKAIGPDEAEKLIWNPKGKNHD